jgi:YVTN family beta-propeller protein
VAGLVGRAAAQSPGAGFVTFESGHVRPLALSPDGSRLFAVNTPDNRLTIYDVTGGGLTLAAEVPVGLEPVAVAARTTTARRGQNCSLTADLITPGTRRAVVQVYDATALGTALGGSPRSRCSPTRRARSRGRRTARGSSRRRSTRATARRRSSSPT